MKNNHFYFVSKFSFHCILIMIKTINLKISCKCRQTRCKSKTKGRGRCEHTNDICGLFEKNKEKDKITHIS